MHEDWDLFLSFYHLLTLVFELSVSQDLPREATICLSVMTARDLQDGACTVLFPECHFFFVGLSKWDHC